MKLNYKFSVCFVFLFLSAGVMSGQNTIAQWNFNGSSDTAVHGGATSPSPSIGVGTAMLVGGTTATFKSGSSLDPVGSSTSNFGWQTSSYAPSGSENKKRGIQFNVSTAGFEGISLKFDQRLSNTANNTYVVQYTIDHTAVSPNWIDFQTFTFTPQASGTGDVWYNSNDRTVDLSSVVAINNNPNAAFRIVSAFDPTVGNYLPAATKAAGTPVSYLTSGNVRFDMVTISSAQTLGTNDNRYQKQAFSFYPNPTNGSIIYFNKPVSVRIFDMMGKTIMNANDIKELNIESLSSGLYFVEDEDKNVVKMIKH